MIAVRNLTKKYGNVTAVDNISFDVETGSIFGFVGPNGAGKTTTMRIMSTLLAATDGTVEIGGQPVHRNPRFIRSIIGYMPDFFGVYDDLRVDEYLEFYGDASGISLTSVRSNMPALLELVGLAEQKQSFVNTLSRGMKQRLCLARTLVHQPQLLILDEPASGLDPRARVELRNILRELQRMGKTIVISSHILAELTQLCTHVGIINDGIMPLCSSIGQVLARVQGDIIIEISVADRQEDARLWLLEQAGVKDAKLTNTGALEIVFSGGHAEQAVLLKNMAAAFTLFAFIPRAGSLEEIFMSITEVKENGQATG